MTNKNIFGHYLQESNEIAIPKAIKMVEGKSYVFQIRLTDFNLKDASQTFTVSKIFELDVNSLNLPTDKASKVIYNNLYFKRLDYF